MISFELTARQEQLRQMGRWLAKDQLRKVALQADRDMAFTDEFLQGLNRMGVNQGGVLGYNEKRGSDAKRERETNRTGVILSEEMGWGDPASVLSFAGPGLGGPPVRFMGTEEQQDRFFGIFNQDELHWGAYGLTEPAAGSDVKAIRTSARRDGDVYVLNGRKVFITNGARADWVVVFATLNPEMGRAAHRAFVVEKGMPGFSVGRIERKMGLRASETAELVFEDCRVPVENLLGGEEHYQKKDGFLGAMQTFDSTRPLVASMAVGMARACIEEVRNFFKANYLTGRPIPRYRALQDKLGHAFHKLQAARFLCWRAAWMADVGKPNAKEASMSKAFAAQVATRICSDACEFLGGHGALRDTIVEKFFRDIKVFDIFEGTGQIQRVVISKRIIPNLRGF